MKWGIGYYRDNLLAQKLLPYIFWISQGGFHRVRDTVAFLERKILDSFLQQCGRRIHRILTQSTIYSVCSVLHEKVYPSRIANVRQLKAHLIDECEHFNQSIVDAANDQWRRRCLSACVRVSGACFEHQFQQVYKISYFVIYLPKVIKLMES